MRTKVAAVIAGASLVLPALAAAELVARFVDQSFAGQAIRLPIPNGYCAIPRHTVRGKSLYEEQEQLLAGSSAIGVLFVDCTEWNAQVSDSSKPIRRRGQYLFVLSRGKEVLIGATRSDFVQRLAASKLLKGGGRLTFQQQLIDLVNERLAKSQAPAPSIGALSTADLAADTHALYIGIASRVLYPGETAYVAGVTAMTLVNRIPVSMSLYDDLSALDTITKLLADQKRNVLHLIQSNP